MKIEQHEEIHFYSVYPDFSCIEKKKKFLVHWYSSCGTFLSYQTTMFLLDVSNWERTRRPVQAPLIWKTLRNAWTYKQKRLENRTNKNPQIKKLQCTSVVEFLLSLQLSIKSTYSIATINFSYGFGFNAHFRPRAVPADAANSWFLWWKKKNRRLKYFSFLKWTKISVRVVDFPVVRA